MNNTVKTYVIALGGNALGNSPEEQLELVKKAAVQIVKMASEGCNIILSHGNGPQVGMIYNAFARASAHAFAHASAHASAHADGKIPPMPFPECGAMSQGYIGYHLSQALHDELKRCGSARSIVTVITRTVVKHDDPAFQNPDKPVGAFLSEEQAKNKMKETGLVYKEDAGRGWRLTVASPKPQYIAEFDAVKTLIDTGYIVIVGGGGGIPVIEKNNTYHGVSAVIDKDRLSAKLAADFKAGMLIILTAVEKAAINFNKSNQRDIDRMTVAEAKDYINQGHFAPGSMLPKIQACIEYLEAFPQGRALITSLECAAAGLQGKTGTQIVFD